MNKYVRIFHIKTNKQFIFSMLCFYHIIIIYIIIIHFIEQKKILI
jgi:hypothetical protein